jgi:hypothetical protein
VFSLGVMLFQLLTGDLTAPMSRAFDVLRQLRERELPPALVRLVSACCADARGRPPDALVLAEELERCRSALERPWGAALAVDRGSTASLADTGLQALADHPAPELLRQKIFGPRCAILEMAAGGKAALAALTPLMERLLPRGALDCWPDRHNQMLLRARLRLLRLLADEAVEPDVLRRGLAAVLRLYESVWTLPATPRRAGVAPAALGQLPATWREAFADAGAEHGWHCPGLLAALDQVLSVRGDGRPGDRTVTTWVLFAWPDHNDSWLCRLTLERVPGGVGGFYPHPLTNGYTAVSDEFQRGLARAWRAAMPAGEPWPSGQGWDVRWSLTPLPIQRVDGASAEAAFTCALRALVEGAELDPHVALTARLRDPDDGTGRLADVSGIALKLHARELWPHQVNEVLVARGQLLEANGVVMLDTEQERELWHEGGRHHVRLIPLTTIEEAYDRLVL